MQQLQNMQHNFLSKIELPIIFVSLFFAQNYLQVIAEVALKLTVRLADDSKVQSQGCLCMLVNFGLKLELVIEFKVLDCDIDCVLGMFFL